MATEQLEACPKCGRTSETPNGEPCNLTAIRDATSLGLRVEIDGIETGLADVGYRCSWCGAEWGFEVFTDEAIAAARSTR
jgi:hypothetical protein